VNIFFSEALCIGLRQHGLQIVAQGVDPIRRCSRAPAGAQRLFILSPVAALCFTTSYHAFDPPDQPRPSASSLRDLLLLGGEVLLTGLFQFALMRITRYA